MTQHVEEALIGYVMRYGGMCRDCADMDGVCQSGMPCDTDQRRAVIRHTIAALTYGIKHGFIENPFIAAALAAAEERGRSEERERSREAIRKAGLKARDEVVDGLSGDGSPDNDLADYLERIVDACANAITKEPTP